MGWPDLVLKPLFTTEQNYNWKPITGFLVFVKLMCLCVCVCSFEGSGDCPARGAATGLGRGDPGWRPRSAMGEALVSCSPDGCYHCSLPVSQPESLLCRRAVGHSCYMVFIAHISSLSAHDPTLFHHGWLNNFTMTLLTLCFIDQCFLLLLFCLSPTSKI